LKKDFLIEVLTKHEIAFVTGKKDIHIPTISRVIAVDLENDTVSTDSNTWFLIAAEIGISVLSGGVV